MLLLNLVSAALYVGVALGSGVPAGFGVTAYVACGPSPSSPIVSGANLQSLTGFTDLAGAVSFIALVVTIFAWLKWRSGIRALEASALEYGGVHEQEAAEAKRFYSYTVWTWVAFVIILSVIAVAGAVSVAGAALMGLQPNGTFQCTQALVDSINARIHALTIAASVGAAIYAIVLYYSATRSLGGSIRGLSPQSLRAEVDAATRWILIGAFLTVGAIGLTVSVYFSLFSVASVALLAFGYWKLRDAYGRWLAQPPQPAAPAWPASPAPVSPFRP